MELDGEIFLRVFANRLYQLTRFQQNLVRIVIECLIFKQLACSALTGLMVGLSATGEMSFAIERVGVLVMLATPVIRVVVACVLFLSEKDWKYGAISFGVLVILLLSAVFGIGEH